MCTHYSNTLNIALSGSITPPPNKPSPSLRTPAIERYESRRITDEFV